MKISDFPRFSKLRYIDKDIFIVYIKTMDIYNDIKDDQEEIFTRSNYEIEQPLPLCKKRKSTKYNKA